MAAMKCLTSLLIALLVVTSMVDGACFRKPLAEDPIRLSVYCPHGQERKQLFTAWVDHEACTHCYCLPSGMQCCSMAPRPGNKGC